MDDISFKMLELLYPVKDKWVESYTVYQKNNLPNGAMPII